MMSGILSPAFLQAAGRAGKKQPTPPTPFSGIKLVSSIDDPSISEITGSDIVVTTVKNGQPHNDTYASLTKSQLLISADANTEIIITGTFSGDLSIGYSAPYSSIRINNTNFGNIVGNGSSSLKLLDLSENENLSNIEFDDSHSLKSIDVTSCPNLQRLSCSSCEILKNLDLSTNIALTELNVSYCYSLQNLDLSKNTALNSLNLGYLYQLQNLDLSKNTALNSLNLECCYQLQNLDLSKNTALNSLGLYDCKIIDSIKYPAINSDVSSAIADSISNSYNPTGTVYTDSAAAYYSTIAGAATAKGWTIEQIPA